ncbi:hypothetical protein L1887_54383 [Cichorium endivia]|nr:hypothetical protein L1887_54383 [Cichorium endivia]
MADSERPAERKRRDKAAACIAVSRRRRIGRKQEGRTCKAGTIWRVAQSGRPSRGGSGVEARWASKQTLDRHRALVASLGGSIVSRLHGGILGSVCSLQLWSREVLEGLALDHALARGLVRSRGGGGGETRRRQLDAGSNVRFLPERPSCARLLENLKILMQLASTFARRAARLALCS